jgi:hypothetical protein
MTTSAFTGTDSHSRLDRCRDTAAGLGFYNDLTDMRGLPNAPQFIQDGPFCELAISRITYPGLPL